jgi:hypothetical protein
VRSAPRSRFESIASGADGFYRPKTKAIVVGARVEAALSTTRDNQETAATG